MHILVVDDDALAGAMTGSILEDAGHQVSCVENGVDAMQTLDQDPGIALVLSDMNMPLINGIELFRTLREQGNQTPFILLTGDDPDALLAEEPGLDGCLTKDFAMAETLEATVRAVAGS